MGVQQATLHSIVGAWEQVIAATVIHYINEVLLDQGRCGAEEYSLVSHAKHWAEMKGFAIGFQFNPRSAVSPTGFLALHTALGDAPVLCAADTSAYAVALEGVRAQLTTDFGFTTVDAENW